MSGFRAGLQSKRRRRMRHAQMRGPACHPTSEWSPQARSRVSITRRRVTSSDHSMRSRRGQGFPMAELGEGSCPRLPRPPRAREGRGGGQSVEKPLGANDEDTRGRGLDRQRGPSAPTAHPRICASGVMMDDPPGASRSCKRGPAGHSLSRAPHLATAPGVRGGRPVFFRFCAKPKIAPVADPSNGRARPLPSRLPAHVRGSAGASSSNTRPFRHRKRVDLPSISSCGSGLCVRGIVCSDPFGGCARAQAARGRASSMALGCGLRLDFVRGRS